MIYSLNERFDVAPTESEISGSFTTVVRFPDLELPQDQNEGPLAVFHIIYVASDALAPTFSSARVNGFTVEVFEPIAMNAAGTQYLVLVASPIAASLFNVELSLAAPRQGTANLLGFSFGNVGDILPAESASTPMDTNGGSIGLTGPGAVALTDALVFTTASISAWVASATRTVEVVSDPELTFPISATTLDVTGVDSRVSYRMGALAALDTLTWEVTGAAGYGAAAVFVAEPLAETPDEFNCECEEETDNETLAQLRRRLLVRLGYAAQADNPPPGMADLLDDFLVQSQRLLYRRYRALRTERFFTWTMIVGQRFYDLPDNDETCNKVLDPYRLSWVGVEDTNGAWYGLVKGIPPEVYTSVENQGLPALYEIRQCIEVFPAPSDNYKLRIKGHFGLTEFDEDTDTTTIDSELVFLWALANAKAHYGQPDASNVAAQAQTYLSTLVSGSHQTARYIPGRSVSPPIPRPLFLGLDP